MLRYVAQDSDKKRYPFILTHTYVSNSTMPEKDKTKTSLIL